MDWKLKSVLIGGLRTLVRVSLLLIILSGCGDELGTTKYAQRHAYFLFTSAPFVPELNAALNNPGQWCTITVDNSGMRYQFEQPTGRPATYWPMPADPREKTHAWVAGLIVGTPSLPEPGLLASVITCYDLVCPTCYQIPIDRRLSIDNIGFASCEGCGCRYDLNNQGVQVGGESRGTRLFRYRISYLAASGRLLVNN